MRIKDYALIAKRRIDSGYHESVAEWAEANYPKGKANWLTEEITRHYGERAEVLEYEN